MSNGNGGEETPFPEAPFDPKGINDIFETNYNNSEIERMKVETALNKSKADFLEKLSALETDPAHVDTPLVGVPGEAPEMKIGLLILLGGAVYFLFIRKKRR